MGQNFLKQQQDDMRFAQALTYIHESAGSIKKLTSSELARLNLILLGKKAEEPWRLGPTQIQLPNGQTHQFNMLSNPISAAREILGQAFEVANDESVSEGAVYLYTRLVLEHLFVDANRRTAVLATIWLLNAYDYDADPQVLLKIPVGDLRNTKDKEEFSEAVLAVVHKKA